jgi:hypothetical protein
VHQELGFETVEVHGESVEKLKLPLVHDSSLLLDPKALVDHFGHTVPVAASKRALVEKALHFEGLIDAGRFNMLLGELDDHFCHARLVPVVHQTDEHVVGRHNENDDLHDHLVHEVHLLVPKRARVDAGVAGIIAELEGDAVVVEGFGGELPEFE